MSFLITRKVSVNDPGDESINHIITALEESLPIPSKDRSRSNNGNERASANDEISSGFGHRGWVFYFVTIISIVCTKQTRRVSGVPQTCVWEP